jgi:PKD repeat protein
MADRMMASCVRMSAVFLGGSLLLLAQAAPGQLLSPERLVDWGNYVGIPGGIPTSRTVYTTIPAGSSQSTIQTALNSAPNNSVVMLAAGTYTISSQLSIPSYKTLRGQGTSTILNLTGGGGGAGISMGSGHGSGSVSAVPPTTPVSSGYNKGSTRMVLGSASGIQKNDLLILTGTFGPFVSTANAENGGDGEQFGAGGNADLMGQTVIVTNISGNTVDFSPPVLWDYTASQSPYVYMLPHTAALYAGLEDVQLQGNNTGLRVNIQIDLAAYCWIKGVEGNNAAGDHVWIAYSLGNEVRHNYFHDGYNHGPGTTDDALKLNWKVTGCLVIDNIFQRMHGSVMVNYGAAGNVIAYNFATNQYHESASTVIPDETIHSSHPSFNLWEGNCGIKFQLDSSHGSSSHSVALRNWMCGENWYGSWQSGYADCFVLNWMTSSNSLVGNIAGCPKFVADGGRYLALATNSYPGRSCFSFGFRYDNSGYTSAMAGYSSLLPWQSVVFHGNYDFVSQSQHWDANIADHTIPKSYFLTAKPAWFGSLNWPPIDPANPATANLTNIPAGYRYVFGVDPPTGPANLAPVAVISASTTSASKTTPISFSSAGSYDPEGVALQYSWNFGDGGTSSLQSPSHTFSGATVPTNYTVRLTVTDGVNSTSTNMSISIFIVGFNSPPSASATANVYGGVAPLNVTFSSAGSSDPEGSPITFNWSFGDGSSSSSPNPSHVYSTSAVYTARLTVSDRTNSTSTNLIISVGNGGASGLVAAYGFEEGSGASVADTSGNGNGGNVTGGTWASTGKYGKALTFGAGSIVSVPDSASLDLSTGMTIEAWVYPTSSAAAYRNIIFKSQGDPGTQPLCYVLQGSTPSSVPAVVTGVSPSSLAAASPLALNTWSHLSATYDGATMNLYVNGILAGSLAQSGAIAASTEPLTIGGNMYSGQNFVGMIDEVRIYNRALSSSEILTDMNSPIAGGSSRPAAPTNLRVVSGN